MLDTVNTIFYRFAMAADMIIGFVVLFVSVVFSTGMFLSSRRRINKIHERGLTSLKEITSEFSRGGK